MSSREYTALSRARNAQVPGTLHACGRLPVCRSSRKLRSLMPFDARWCSLLAAKRAQHAPHMMHTQLLLMAILMPCVFALQHCGLGTCLLRTACALQ